MKNKIHLDKDNLMAKILSIIMAILLWSYVMNAVDPIKTRVFPGIPIKVEDKTDLKERGLTIINPSEETAIVKLEGRRSYVDKISSESIQATVSLKDLDKGEHSVPVKITIPNENVAVASQDPDHIIFILDENIEITEKVEVKTIGTLDDGYILGEIKQSLDEVKVTGPKSIVDQIHSLLVYVDLNNKKETTVITSDIKAFDNNIEELSGIVIEPGKIDIEIPIYKTTTVPITLDIRGNPPSDFQEEELTIEPDTVTISGNSAVINKVKEIKTKPIYWSNILDGITTTVELVEPEGIKIVNSKQIHSLQYKPSTFTTKEITLNKPTINLNGLLDGFVGEILESPEVVKVSLQGDEEKINQLTEKNIQLYIDCSNLEEGEHSVNLRTNTIENVSISGIEPNILKIIIKRSE